MTNKKLIVLTTGHGLAAALARALVVPRAGIEPALLSETHFECAASTSSANGAHEETATDYYTENQEVKSDQTLPHSAQCDKMAPFELRLSDILGNIVLPYGWTGKVGINELADGRHQYYLQIEDKNGVCNVTGKPDPWRGRKWALSQFMTDGEIVNTIWKAAMTAAEHELREGFKYKGVTIYDPHYDPDALVDFMKTKGSRKWRDDGMTEVA